MKLLLTAFDPFGGEPVNPALEAVKLVSDTVGSVQVVKLEVPTLFPYTTLFRSCFRQIH